MKFNRTLRILFATMLLSVLLSSGWAILAPSDAEASRNLDYFICQMNPDRTIDNSPCGGCPSGTRCVQKVRSLTGSFAGSCCFLEFLPTCQPEGCIVKRCDTFFCDF